MGMFGIAYAQRSPKGATRGRESCNLPRLRASYALGLGS